MNQYEAPPPYDMTIESDMEFRGIMQSMSSVQSLAASKCPPDDFMLLNEIRRLTPPHPSGGVGVADISSPPIPAIGKRYILSSKIETVLKQGLGGVDFRVEMQHNNGTVHFEGYGDIIMVRDLVVGKSAHHEKLHIENQGANIGKVLMSNHVRLYTFMGISMIYLHANYIGRYAWAKYGFSCPASELTSRFQALRGLVRDNDRLVAPIHPKHIGQIAAAHIPGEKMGEFLRCCTEREAYQTHIMDKIYRAPDGSFLLGKCFLLNGPVWRGVLDLRSGMGRRIFDYYTKSQARVAVR